MHKALDVTLDITGEDDLAETVNSEGIEMARALKDMVTEIADLPDADDAAPAKAVIAQDVATIARHGGAEAQAPAASFGTLRVSAKALNQLINMGRRSIRHSKTGQISSDEQVEYFRNAVDGISAPAGADETVVVKRDDISNLVKQMDRMIEVAEMDDVADRCDRILMRDAIRRVKTVVKAGYQYRKPHGFDNCAARAA
jgi:hypothetical protein